MCTKPPENQVQSTKCVHTPKNFHTKRIALISKMQSVNYERVASANVVIADSTNPLKLKKRYFVKQKWLGSFQKRNNFANHLNCTWV